MKKIKAFTLAEVLIVIGIIGIIAECTIPVLFMDVRKQETSVRLKKFYSTMSQAILLSEVDNGPSENWNYNSYSSDGIIFFKNFIAPYMKYSKIDESSNKVYLNDGSDFSMGIGSCVDIQFDTNGDKKPNIYGKDTFVFLFCANGNQNYYFGRSDKTFGTYGETYTRADALNRCQNNSYMCSTLLQLDGWEFKDDYPYKL